MEDYHLYVALAMLLYCLFSARISAFSITMPMFFLTLGVVIGLHGMTFELGAATTFHDLAEVTLAILLFADATLLRREALDKIGKRTARMLLLGLPFAILFGSVINLFLLPGWPLWEACLLAALLAPTDAALGQSIQSNVRIPQVLRDAMNAESGLNDGLALPVVIFFAGMAVGGTGHGAEDGSLLSLLATQIGLGAIVGIVVGALAGFARNRVTERNLMEAGLGQVATLALVGFAFLASEHLGGNAFVAVFVSGLAFANTASGPVHHAREFLEGGGQFLAMLSFFFIGALFVPKALEHATLAGLLVVGLSLVIARPLAIWVSLAGTDTAPNERLFFGWFGPRGLATALFAVFVLMDFEGIEQADGILVIAITAVLISAFVHGISAKWACEIFNLGNEDDPET